MENMKMSNNFKLVETDKLIPYARNARTHSQEQVKQIQASLREFGFINPILIDKDFNIIAGHGRLLAAKAEGLTKVPCVLIEHLTEAQKRAYILAGNKIAENACWDVEMLKIELTELQDLDFNLELTGFADMEIDELLFEEADEAKEDDFEIVLTANPKSKLGDIYQLGRHRLMCGDSTNKATVEKLMDGKKADMVFTDPPYGVDYEGINNDSRSGLERLLRAAFENYRENCIDGASVYCFHSDKCADIFHNVFRSFCHFSSMIIWEKQSLVLSQGDYQSIHEPCLYGWFDNGTHRYFGDRKQTSVWHFDRKSIEGHTTPKPIGFICRALENSSKKKEAVLDLFGGSGSTLIACEQLDRTCYMMELDCRYVQVIIERYINLTGGKVYRLNPDGTKTEWSEIV